MIRAAEPPTIREIANAVGVTPTTVSLALRDSPRISNKMRLRVKRTADDMGYRPNAELSRVMMQLKNRTKGDARPVIALVREGKALRSNTDSVRTVFQEVAENAGYAIDEIFIGEPKMRLDRMADVLRNRGIRGGLLYRLDGLAPETKDWAHDLALCCIGAPPRGTTLPSCDWFTPDAEGLSENPLIQTALDLLSFKLQHHRFGMPEHALQFTVSTPCTH